jgi:hypothetical protein
MAEAKAANRLLPALQRYGKGNSAGAGAVGGRGD